MNKPNARRGALNYLKGSTLAILLSCTLGGGTSWAAIYEISNQPQGVYAGPSIRLNFTTDNNPDGSERYLRVYYKENRVASPLWQEGSREVFLPLDNASHPYPWAVCVRSFENSTNPTVIEEWPSNGGCSNPALYAIAPRVETRQASNGFFPPTSPSVFWSNQPESVNFTVRPNTEMGALNLQSQYRWLMAEGPGGQGSIPVSGSTINVSEGDSTLIVESLDSNGVAVPNSGGNYYFKIDTKEPFYEATPARGTHQVLIPSDTILIRMVDPMPGSGPRTSQSIQAKWFNDDASCSQAVSWSNSSTPPGNTSFSSNSETLLVNAPTTSGSNYCLGVWMSDKAGNVFYDGWGGYSIQVDNTKPNVWMRVYKKGTLNLIGQYETSGQVGPFNERIDVEILSFDPNNTDGTAGAGIQFFAGFPNPTFINPPRGSYVLGNVGYHRYENIAPSGHYTWSGTSRDLAGNENTYNFSFQLNLPPTNVTNLTSTVVDRKTVTYQWTTPTGEFDHYQLVSRDNPSVVIKDNIAKKAAGAADTLTVDYETITPIPAIPVGYSGNNKSNVMLLSCETTNGCQDGVQSNAAPGEPKWTVAVAPTGLQANSVQETSADLQWNTNNNSPVTRYILTIPGASPRTITPNTEASVHNEPATGLTPNTSYTFRVKARNGADSDTAEATSPAFCTKPLALQPITSGGSSTAIQITLNVNVTDGNPTTPARQLLVSDRSDFSTTVYNQPVSASGNVQVGGLQGGRKYYAKTRLAVPSGCATTAVESPVFETSTSFSEPQTVTVLDNLATATAFFVQVTPKSGEFPECAIVEYNGGSSAPAPLSGPIQVNVTTSNEQFGGVKAKVGSGNCSDAGPTRGASSDGYTRPAKPGSPAATTMGPTSIQVQFNADPSNSIGTQNFLKYWTAADCSGTAPATATSTTPQALAFTTVSPLTPGTLYCFQTVTVAKRNPPTWNVASDEPNGQAYTQFGAPAGAVTANNTDALLTASDAFVVTIPRPTGTLAPWAQIRFNPGTTPVAIDMAPFKGNSTPIKVAVPGVQPNRGYNQLQARFVASEAADDTLPTSAWSTIDNSQTAWTKPEAPAAPSVTSPDATRNITATFSYPTANPIGTKYFLQVKAESNGTFSWDLTTPEGQLTPLTEHPTPAIQGTTAASITMQLPAGAGTVYHVRLRAENLSTSPRYANLDNFSTPDAFPGVIRYTKPNVSVVPGTLTTNSISVRIQPVSGETPSVFIASFTSVADRSIFGTKSVTVAADGNAQVIDAIVSVANSSYTIWGQVGDVNPLSQSGYQLAPTLAWTKPEAPAVAFTNYLPSLTSIALENTIPVANSPMTRYEIQAVINDPANFANNAAIIRTPIFRAAEPLPTITGLTANSNYFVRIRVLSDLNATNDVFSPIDGPIQTTPPDARGRFVDSSSNTITAYWDTVNTSNVEFVQASAVNPQGQINISEPLLPPYPAYPLALPNIIVKNLPVANTVYTLTLEKSDAGFIQTYPRSNVNGITKAAIPNKPGLDISGINPTFTLVVLADFTDFNASDSRYAVEVTSNSQPAKYLNGVGGLSDTPVLQVRSAWTPTALSFVNAGTATTYKVRLAVAQKASADSLVYSEAATVIMPGGGISAAFPSLNGQVMDNYLFGVPVSGPFTVNFTAAMLNSQAAFAQKIRILRVSDAEPVRIGFTYTDDPQTNTHRLDINLLDPMEPATEYQILIDAGLQDRWGFVTTQAFTQRFITGINPAIRTTIYSPSDTGKTSPVVVEPNTLGATTIVIPRMRFVNPPSAITATTGAIDSNLGNKLIREIKRLELLFYTLNAQGQPVLGTAPRTVRLTLGAGTGAASAGSPSMAPASLAGFDLSTLSLYQLTSNGLQKVPGAIINADGTVSADVSQSGLYVFMAAISTSLDGAFAYPVPFKPSEGHTNITFRNVAPESTIKIYTIMGELVQELRDVPSTSGEVIWAGVRNRDGEPVASGVYIYQIKNPYSEKRGKVMVIR